MVYITGIIKSLCTSTYGQTQYFSLGSSNETCFLFLGSVLVNRMLKVYLPAQRALHSMWMDFICQRNIFVDSKTEYSFNEAAEFQLSGVVLTSNKKDTYNEVWASHSQDTVTNRKERHKIGQNKTQDQTTF